MTMLKIIICLMLVPAFAELRVLEKMSMTKNYRSWLREIRSNAFTQIKKEGPESSNYTECRESEELEGVFVCTSFLRQTMNNIFTRISMYSEGDSNVPTGTVVTLDNPEYLFMRLRPSGHDISHKELYGFFKEVNKKCNFDSSYCLNELEDELNSKLLKLHNVKTIISTGVESIHNSWTVLEHEMRHAQFFTKEEFRKNVFLFWNEVLSENEREAVRVDLKNSFYDRENELVMVNEFQAFVLTAEKISSITLLPFIEKYSTQMREYLKKKGTPALKFNNVE